MKKMKSMGMGKSSKGQPGFGRKMKGFSGSVGKSHKSFGKEMSPAGKMGK